MNITDLAIRRPVATAMVFLIIITLGFTGLRHLPIDLLPPIEYPQLSVHVEYPNVGPAEIERIIVEPIENALAGVPGVERVRSAASLGSGNVTLNFARGVNLDAAANDVRAALDGVRGRLPAEAGQPRVWKFDPNDWPIVVMGASSDIWDLQELSLILQRDVLKRFEQIPGVGSVRVWGGVNRQVEVRLQRDRLNASGLSAADVQAALAASNVNLPGGNVSTGTRDIYLRTLGEFTDLDQIRDTVIRTIGGQPIRIRDVAEVNLGYEDLNRLVRIDGNPMLRFGINKQSGANTVAIAAALRAEMERINASRSDVRLFVATDESVFIQQSIDTVRNSTLWGALLAVTVLYLFLRRGSSTFIIAVVIPISIIATFGLLYFSGLTLNQMSFGGLALGVGLVVDNAVVVLENITRQREEGKDPVEAARLGTREVAGAITASTLTTAVIFLPVVFMQTITGVLFQQLALVVVFALLCSLAVALTLAPMLAARLLRRPVTPQGRPGRVQAAFDALDRFYARALETAIRRKGSVLLSAGGAVVLGFLALPLIPVELTPQTEADEVDIDLFMAPGTNIAVLSEYLNEMESKVREVISPEDTRFFTTDIRDARAEVRFGVPRDSPQGAFALADKLRPVLDGQIPGADIRIQARSGLWILRRVFSAGGGGDDITLQIRGYDLDQAQAIGELVEAAILDVPGVVGVRVAQLRGRPETAVHLDRARLAELGLSVREVGAVIQTNVSGARAGFFRVGGDEFPIVVRLRPEDRRTAQSLGNIPITLPNGEIIPLSAVIDARAGLGPSDINRTDGQRFTTVTANLVSGTPMGNAVRAIQNRLNAVDMPPGFSVYIGGEYEEQQKAARDFRLSILIALLLVYMVMAAQFERFLDPLIVLGAVPLAVIGVVPTLLLTGTTFNMQSLMGLIMLIGIVVNNAIVLVDYVNLLRRERGLDPAAAMRLAGRRRLRPILMTTLTTVLGLLPLALGIGPGAEIQAALARVVLGGLLASTLVTLVFIPALYLTCHEILYAVRRRAALWGLPGFDSARADATP
jgi:hydrophobic/amphiphilic exporter-1 (mainly G- bacteria), HAE1 family